MYEEYFGLKRPPFRITPDTSLFYDGGHRGDVLGALVYAVQRGEGIIKVVGEVGSGKTMLCRMLQQELPESVEIIYIANPSVSPEDILFVIASELHFEIDRHASKHEVVSMLHHYLLKRHAENKQVVLFVEEAQGMPLETLEEIRLLSNLETDQHKLLQMILFGQPELDQNLSNNSIRQLRERITHDFNLNPLTGADIHQYLNFRMREVGYTGPELISDKLAASMAKYSEGLLRRINILADKMLLSAFAEGTHTLTTKHLQAAVKDSGFSKLAASTAGSGNGLFWLTGLAVLLLVAVAYVIMQSQFLPASFSSGENILSPDAEISKITENGQTLTRLDRSLPDVKKTVDTQSELMNEEIATLDKVDVATIDTQQQEAQKKVNRNVSVETIIKDSGRSKKKSVTSIKTQQSTAKLDIVYNKQVNQAQADKNQPDNGQITRKKSKDYQIWLNKKIESSKQWLRSADKQSVSIQVMMRSKSAESDLVEFLTTEWPLDLDKTHLYEVKMKGEHIFRVFYGEYPSITSGQIGMKQLPESVRVNAPYLNSVYRMQKALL